MRLLLLLSMIFLLSSFGVVESARPKTSRENDNSNKELEKRLLSSTSTGLSEALSLIDGVVEDKGGYVHGTGLFNHDCTPAHREAILSLVRLGYGGSPSLLQEQAYFREIPFALDNKVMIAPDGLPLIPVAIDRRTTLLLTLYTSAIIDHITPTYRSFTSNLTSVIDAEVHLGLHGIVGLPVSFKANVFFDFDEEFCEIKEVRAFANIPWHVLELCVNLPGLPLRMILTSFLGQNNLLDPLLNKRSP